MSFPANLSLRMMTIFFMSTILVTRIVYIAILSQSNWIAIFTTIMCLNDDDVRWFFKIYAYTFVETRKRDRECFVLGAARTARSLGCT
jgi:cytochrome b subunit of formate dehydrogenase